MATTSNNSGQRASLRVAGLATAPALGGLLLLELIAPAQAAADVQTVTGTVTLSSTSSTQSVPLDQFDPTAGLLTQITITVAVDASADVEVTNLTPAAKATTVTLEVSASAAGPGGSGATATAIDTASTNLAPNASLTFGVDATADEDQVITDPAVLAPFIGTGTVSFNLTGLVGADVEGPSTWRGRGAMAATAAVTLAYDFTPNAPPTAVADAATVTEDDPPTAIPVLANDTDADGGPISIASVTQPANGTVAITGGGTGLTYQPNPNHCNTPPGTTLDTFTYTLTPGTSTATVTITVTCVNDPPIAVDDTQPVAEDSTATTIDVLANDTDPEGDTFIVDAVTQPANGTVAITNSGDDISYQPNANYCNSQSGGSPDTFTYTLDPGGATATVSVTVICVDDPPVAIDDTTPVAEDAPATPVDVLANDTNPDGGPIAIDTVTQPANGTVAITGSGTGVTYQPNLNYCNTPPGTTLDTFTYTLAPGGDTATVSVTVTCVDDPPAAVADSATVVEDAPATAIPVLANDTDVDGGQISIVSATQPTDGTVAITGGGTGLAYQPNPNFCSTTPDTFTYMLNGGSSATVSVTVTCVDDPPVAVNDSATVVEDAPATAIPVLANDTDVDGGPISIGAVTQPTNGTVAITGGGTGLTYQPDPNYCNTPPGPPGAPLDTFTYTLTPGTSTATVSITVTCVDDMPVAVDDTTTVAEDAPATPLDVLANDTDIDGGPKTVNTVTQPTNGTVEITGSGTGLTYQPNLNFCSTTPDTFDYTLAPGSSTATVSVTVTCVDDPPVAVNDTATVTEDAPATAIPVLANDTDVDGGPISIASVTQPSDGTVVITGGGTNLTYQPDLNYCNTGTGGSPDTFTYTLAPGISTATVSMTVTCVVEDPVAVDDAVTVGEDSGATVIDVLDNDLNPDELEISIDAASDPANGTVVVNPDGSELTYQPDANYCNTPPGTTLDTFTYTLDPGSDIATVTVTVTCVDDAPVAVSDAATVLEDAAATAILVLGNDTDIDAGPISIFSASDPVHGTVVVTGGGTGLTYQPDPNYCNTPPGATLDTFTYTLTPGTSTATVSVTVTCVNDAPTITLSGSTPTFTEGGPAVTIDAALTITDVDDTSLVLGTVSITAGLVPGDTLTFTSAGGIIDTNSAPGVLDLVGITTIADWQTVLQSVQFSTASDDPTAATRTVSFTVNDGDTPSKTAAKPVTVVPVNDAPALTQPDTAPLAYTEGAAPTLIAPNITAADVDSPNLVAATIDIGAGYVNGQDVLSLGTNPQNGITATFDPATGTLTLTGISTVANYQTALRDVRYANTSQDPTAGTRTITFQVDDGPGPNDLSNVVTRGVTVTPVNDAPVAGDDSYTGTNGALANTRLAVGTTTTGPHLAVSGTVLSNDTDVDTATGLSAGPATISSANCAGCNNVTLNTNGSFTYDPPADFIGTDTFTYTVNDNDPETPANQTDTATVTIQVFGPVVWYVDVDAAAPPAGQGGRSHSPFNSLTPLTTGGTADTLDGDGDIIFVGVDSVAPIAAYDSGIVLEANQKLWGEPFGLTVDPGGAVAATPPSTILVAATPATPATGNPNIRNSATGGVGITLANGVDVQRVNAGVTGTASTTGISGAAITTATIGPNQLVQGNTTGVSLTGVAGGNITVAATINGNTGTVVNVANRSSGTVTFSGNLTGSSANSAITLTSNAGANVDFTGAINLNSTAASITAFSASGGGTITATNAANQVDSFSGTGVNLSGVAIGTNGFTLNTVSSAGAANGILLTNVAGPGMFTVNSGAITATTRALDVDDNSANINVGATLTATGTAARSVEVTNRDGGTVDINGLVTDNSQGINLSTNGTGLVRFDGGISASTGANPAFVSAVSGNLAITDTNGATAPNNTLTTTTGTALSVQNTTIHADDLTFLSISANGAANGIVLNNTGTGGNLAVTGGGTTTQGGDNSGGTIQATTGHGISLTNTTGVSFRNLRLLNTGNSGINGTQVNGFSFTDGTITGAGDASDENSITFDDSLTSTPNLTGVVTITNNVISQTEAEGIDIENWAGTITTATISNNALSDTGDVATPGSAVTLIGSGLATSAASIDRATITNNTIVDFRAGVGIQVRAGNPNAGAPVGHAGTAGSATDVITITGNSMNGGNGGIGNQPDRFFTGGVSGNGGQGNFNISNNGTAASRLRNIDCIAIEVQMDGPVTMTSTVQNNFINANSAVGCAGIAVGTDDPNNLGAGTHTTLISANNVMGTDGPGIFPIVRASGSTMVAKVLNNTVAAPITTNAARAGIRVDSGSAVGDTTMCLEISGNTTAGSTNSATATTSPGINLRKQGTDPAINTFGIEGMAATASPGIENFVNGLNTSTSGTFGVGGTALLSAQSGFTNCNAP